MPYSRILTLEEQLENTKLSVKKIQDIVGTCRSIGVENNNYYRTGAYDICTSASFFLGLGNIEECHLLLDYAHAMVTCFNRKFDIDVYIDTLITSNSCPQVHLCQPGYSKGETEDWMYDAHELPEKDLTQKVIRLMLKRDIEFLTVEYYKDSETLLTWLEWVGSLPELSKQ